MKAPNAVAFALLLLSSACGAPSLVEQCQSACQHIYKDCLTGNSCKECLKYPEDGADEAACVADCETRPNICLDAGVLYTCLNSADCSQPSKEFLATCYSAAECVSLTGENGGPTASLATWSNAGEDNNGTVERSPGGSIEIDWVGAPGQTSYFCSGSAIGLPAADLLVLASGTSPLTIPGTFTATGDDAGCSGECEICTTDGGLCTGLSLGDGQYWQWVPASGTIEIVEVSSLHVAGSFSATRTLEDGGVAALKGTFDAPRGCVYTPAEPPPPISCGSGGTQFGAAWVLGLFRIRPRSPTSGSRRR